MLRIKVYRSLLYISNLRIKSIALLHTTFQEVIFHALAFLDLQWQFVMTSTCIFKVSCQLEAGVEEREMCQTSTQIFRYHIFWYHQPILQNYMLTGSPFNIKKTIFIQFLQQLLNKPKIKKYGPGFDEIALQPIINRLYLNSVY